jgi:hypothetical protein
MLQEVVVPNDPTVREVAGIITRSEEHVRRLLRSGKLQGYKRGRDWYVEAWSVQQFLRRGSRAQLRIACEWLALTDRTAAETTIRRLLSSTFGLDGADVEELVKTWKNQPISRQNRGG